MANPPISGAIYTTSLTGAEDLEVKRSGFPIITTTQAIANLGGGGGLPDQTDHAFAYLTTDGTTASWGGVGTGTNSTQLGVSADASGVNSTALGNGAVASATGSVAIGRESTAEGFRGSVAISGVTTTGGFVALGGGAVASGFGAIALGGATAGGYQSFASGQSTQATGYGSWASGASAQASNTFSMALGYLTQATGANSIAMGANANDGGVDNTWAVNPAWGLVPGDILVVTTANQITRLPKGTNGQVLTMVAGAPAWA